MLSPSVFFIITNKDIKTHYRCIGRQVTCLLILSVLGKLTIKLTDKSLLYSLETFSFHYVKGRMMHSLQILPSKQIFIF